VGLTNAHSGTSPTQAEVILLTRPIRVESTSTTLMGYVYLGGAAVCNWAWAALRYLGSTTTGKRGLEVDINTGSLTMSYCALRNFDRHGLYTAATDWNHVTISNLTSYAVGANASQDSAIRVSASTASPLDCTLSEIDVIGGGASQGVGIYVFDLGVTITTARLSGGGGSGLRVDAANENQVGIISGITSHSHAEANFRIDDCGVLKMSNLTGYRSASASFGGLYVVAVHKLVINTITLFGNSARNIMWETTGKGRLHILNGTFAGDSTFASARGFQNSANNFVVARFDNCTFGVASGIFVTHSTADINLVATSATARAIDLTLNNVTLASATEVENQASQAGYSAVRYQRVDGATGVHKVEYPALGTVSLDTVTFRTAAPSEKLAPTGASSAVKLESAPRRKRVALGGTVSITAYVRKDGSYNGNAARLVVRANPAIGIDNDTVLDTHTAAADTWEALGGVTPAAEEAGVVEFFVDCDGTAGAIYVDDTAAV
jgi:hypothetical protein